jgi:hypothetical protein
MAHIVQQSFFNYLFHYIRFAFFLRYDPTQQQNTTEIPLGRRTTRETRAMTMTTTSTTTRRRRRSPMLRLLCMLLLWCGCFAQEFNFEVEQRILERLEFYMGDPVAASTLIENFRSNGVFPHDLRAPDRDLYLALAFGVSQPLVYYALEDGTIPG